MALDVSGLSFFMPIFSFFLVFIIVYSILFATKIIGESKWLILFVSFIIAVIFISFSPASLFVQEVVPWVAILLVIVFLVLLVLMFQGSKGVIGNKTFAGILIALLIIIFILVAIKVFNPIFKPVLPGTPVENDFWASVKNFLYSGKFLGSALLIALAYIVAKIITKK